MTLLLLAATVFAGVWSARAIRLDAADEYHLAHGPNTDCLECAA